MFEGRWEMFCELLHEAKVNPKKKVLDLIAERHYAGVDAAASSMGQTVGFYEMIRDLPSTKN